jgi:hypothetical protein
MSRKYENYQKYYQQSPRGRYTTHRANSLRRGLDWEFTFEEWWQVWKDSGKWEQRGKSADSYCMARINDEGPYCADNVVITTMTENSRQACDGIKHRRVREATEWNPTPWADRKSAWDYRWDEARWAELKQRKYRD